MTQAGAQQPPTPSAAIPPAPPRRDGQGWQPQGEVYTHDGEPIPGEMDFFAPPPPQIGEVRSAYSTAVLGKEPMSGGARLGLTLGLMFATVAALWLLGLMIFNNAGEAAVLGIGVGGPVSLGVGLFVWLMTRYKARCDYVGGLGMARYTAKRSRDQVAKEELFTFDQAVDLFTAETRNFYNGVYTGTSYDFRWCDENGKNAFRCKGTYHSKEGTPKSKDPYWFAKSGELAWNAFLIEAMADELDRDGSVLFKVNKRDWVRVGPGFFIFCFKGDEQRIDVDQIADLQINQGTFLIKTPDARWFSGKGKFGFQYGQMANAQLFLHCLEHLCGYRFE